MFWYSLIRLNSVIVKGLIIKDLLNILVVIFIFLFYNQLVKQKLTFNKNYNNLSTYFKYLIINYLHLKIMILIFMENISICI